MAIASRVFTCDVTAFNLVGPLTLAGNGPLASGSPPTTNILAVFTDARLNIDIETDESRAARDIMDATILGFGKQRFKSRGWSLDVSTVVDGAADANTLLALALSAVSTGTVPGLKGMGLFSVFITMPGGASPGADTTTSFEGTGFITSAEFRLEDGPQMQSATITGYGQLYATSP